MSLTAAGGISWSGGARVGTLALTFDPQYLGPNLELYNNNLSVVDTDSGQFTVLTTFNPSPNARYMVSYTLDFYTDPYSFVGIGNLSTDLTTILGANANSIGYQSNGDLYFDAGLINDGYPVFETAGAVIDLAVDTQAAKMWLRVNGGNWNGNISGNPVTGDFFVDISAVALGRPAITVGGFSDASAFSIRRYPQYSVPVGYTFIGS